MSFGSPGIPQFPPPTFYRSTCSVLILYVQDGMTALFIASWKDHVAIVQLLLQKRADVSICKKV